LSHLFIEGHKPTAEFTPLLRDEENALSVQRSGNGKD